LSLGYFVTALNMDSDTQVSQLEQALLHQAETLAREHLQNAALAQARIRAETDERLKLRTEREVLAAKAEAERLVRQRLQAAETRLAADLDRLRWALTQAVLAQMRESLQELVLDVERYHELLAELLAAAAAQLPAGDLVVEAVPGDVAGLQRVWPTLTARAAPGRRVELAALAEPALGGMRVRLADNRAQVDQTFEARQERLAEDLARLAMERLFANAPDLGTLVHG
jgi:V/A-type H+/Na+-transporting ATPase subunit E